MIPVFIEEEMKDSYLDYSMSVIVSRALPDVRDGLKPSQRRILVAMHDLNLAPGRPYRKCAKIAGDTSGNYHPHGEQVVYPTLVRMAQDFNLRYPLVDGQGNFGSIDGDPPAAMRYTEARLTPLAVEMLAELDKETVDFVPNYDETRTEPTVLPARFPNLICNGSTGIAVGMATSIPPHNLSEVVDALVALIENPELEIEGLMEYIQGPDFPTGALIFGRDGIEKAYRTGRGKIIVRARSQIETGKGGKESIVITEIPYLVNKASLIEKIAQLVRDKKIEGVADLRDESDREGMRIVVELKKGVPADVILNQLYNHTQLQSTFGVVMLALVEGQPRILNLKQLLQSYLAHRHEVVVRRTRFELAQDEKRAHILEGLKVALEHINEIVTLIKRSPSPQEAKGVLIKEFDLTEVQAQSILDMRLQRLTSLEQRKVEEEYLQLIKRIVELKGVLESKAKRMAIIKEDLLRLKEKYGDPRQTEIVAQRVEELALEDLILVDDAVIILTHVGYIKRMPVESYRRQRKGGKGGSGMSLRELDFVEYLLVASTHDHILFFTNKGRCYWLKVYQIPEGGRSTRGKALVNLLQMAEDEKITALLPVQEFDGGHYLFMATRNGLVKKTRLSAYTNLRRRGIRAISMDEEDGLIGVGITDGSKEILLGTKRGLAIRFPESEVREMGRMAQGVKGITLEDGDEVVDMVVAGDKDYLLVVTEGGFGKRTGLEDFPVTHRGGKGIIALRTTLKNGSAVAYRGVAEDDEIILISAKGVIIRLPVSGVKISGRNTQGVKLINLDDGDWVANVARLEGDKNNG